MEPPAKRSRRDGANRDTQILSSFMNWLAEEGVTISNKIQITKQSCSRYGAIARENIDSGEVLFTIPRYLICINA